MNTDKKFFHRRYLLFALLVIFTTLMVSEPAFAQQYSARSNITVETDKSSYIFGDTITISGYVKTVVQGSILTIRVLDQYSNLVQTAQGIVDPDGQYTGTIEIGGSMWKSGGVYTVQVQYGSAQTQTTFSYTATTAPISGKFQVQIPYDQQVFDVPYSISGGSVSNMNVNPTNLSLAVLIQSENYGAITLSIPRSLLDSKTSDGTDIPFVILTDGVEIKPQREQVTPSVRTLTIQFLQGDKVIQIIGTNVGSQNGITPSTPNENLNTNPQPYTQPTNMSQTIPAVPEFPNVTILFMIAMISIAVLVRISCSRIQL